MTLINQYFFQLTGLGVTRIKQFYSLFEFQTQKERLKNDISNQHKRKMNRGIKKIIVPNEIYLSPN